MILREDAVGFRVPGGIPDDPRLRSRPIDARVPDPMRVVPAQMRGRLMPVVPAKFADRLAARLNDQAGA